jgi:hypothetical protein
MHTDIQASRGIRAGEDRETTVIDNICIESNALASLYGIEW